MAEYIDRNRLVDNLHDEEEMGVSDMWEAIDNAIDRTPVADVVKVVRAHWILSSDVMEYPDGPWRRYWVKCSCCGNREYYGQEPCYKANDREALAAVTEGSPYCRKCGAKMDEEAAENG